MMKKTTKYLAFLFGMLLFASCEDGKSYSDLLSEEEDAVNWYLAQNRVVTRVPEDSVFEVGEDAPFYRMNSDGSVYMRVINAGDPDNRPEKGQKVYLRFMRYDILTMKAGGTSGVGNNNGMGDNSISLIYGNQVLTSTTQYGEGIQVPLKYLGYNCEVDLVVKSTDGFTTDISECIPYLYKNLKYFKAEY